MGSLVVAVLAELAGLLRRGELVSKSICKLSVEGGVVCILILGLAEGARLVLVEVLREGLRVGEAERLSVVQIIDGRDGRSLLLLLVQVLVEVCDLDTNVIAVSVGDVNVVLVGSSREAETLATTGIALTTECKVIILVCVGRLGGGQVGVLVLVVIGIIDGVVVGVVWVIVLVPLVIVVGVLAVVRLAVAWVVLVVGVGCGSIALARRRGSEGDEGSEEESGLSELHFDS